MITIKAQTLKSRFNGIMLSPNKNYDVVLSDKVLSITKNRHFIKYQETSQENICIRNQCYKTFLKNLLLHRVFPGNFSFSKQLYFKTHLSSTLNNFLH